jgi:hypothetical protein
MPVRTRHVLCAALLAAVLSIVLFRPADSAAPARTGGDNAPTATVRVDHNVETLGILLALAFEQYKFGGFSLPVAAQAQAELAPHRPHPAVTASRALVQELSIDGYTILALHAAPFGGPDAGRLHRPLPESRLRAAGDGDAVAGRARLLDYLEQVAAFYRAADLEAFFDARRAGYERAEAEVRRVAPSPALLAGMERYFGERLRSYTIVPTLTHPPHGNVGAALPCPEGPAAEAACREAVFVMGTQVSVAPEAFAAGTAAGFYDDAAPADSRQIATDLVVHEFGHAFINPYLETPAVWAELERYGHMMLAPLRARMAPQAYRTWTAVAVEHVVRTAEVRVALAMGDTARADRLRRTHVEDRAFVYLPHLEQTAARYEQAPPDRYATFGAFVPEMVEAFGTADTLQAYERLGVGVGPLRRVTIRVEGPVPAGDTVFVTGNHRALADWAPRGVPLRRGADGAWDATVEVEAGTRIEYKVTRGTWPTEAADATGTPLPNASAVVRGDTTITVSVPRWRDGPR